MSTARAKLQELKLPQLREMASSVDVDHDGLQKSKLIAAILDSEKFAPTLDNVYSYDVERPEPVSP